ncbi:hypothetical protein Q8791_23660 [Nocardiopsis sp. CT-R113]|uniref:Uncharacterized protein n=1 Tax=Nocardiopsis codii TaxID=3065942 RepID=A0ABU7KDD3_9ACTN|nr:hypothetical protein [Nocardiopsis sp. CT-R113]MEE2040217.1 hypothetical protein [Nocardiopsis sp. CT-R113]
MTTAPAYAPSIDSLLNSTLWTKREGARYAYLNAHTTFLWHRAIWRRNPTPTNRAAYLAARDAELAALHKHNQMDGAVFSKLAKLGVDVDQLPADRDDCPRCKTEAVEGYGCDCTNVVLAVELG